jgi:hypothetical protein
MLFTLACFDSSSRLPVFAHERVNSNGGLMSFKVVLFHWSASNTIYGIFEQVSPQKKLDNTAALLVNGNTDLRNDSDSWMAEQ